MTNHALAVKGIIVHNDMFLAMKRPMNAPHKPGSWDIPGGRLAEGENPKLGLQREIQEETGLTTEVQKPLDVNFFTRDDDQQITMIIFWCTAKTTDVTLSEEHTELQWLSTKTLHQELAWLDASLTHLQQQP